MSGFRMKWIGVAVCCGLLCISSTAASAGDFESGQAVAVAKTRVGGISWQAGVDFGKAVLTVAGPDGSVLRREFGSAEQILLHANDLEIAAMGDGQFSWQLQLAPVVTEKQAEALEAARTAGDAHARENLKRAGELPAVLPAVSGHFRIKGGSIVVSPGAEPQMRTPSARVVPAGSTAPSVATDTDGATKDQLFYDDLIVVGSACVGQDCNNGESFGFDTLRLKENNLRIKFQDTSTSASFPTNDWQLTANDSANGGANKFSVEDIDGGRTPFTLTAGAPSNSLFVASNGRLGLGTSTPSVEIHSSNGDTPTLRLDQNGSSGWAPQIWDVAGNEANFFIRDVTNASKLPFRIQPGAPTDSLYVKSNGSVGLGTNSPTAAFHVQQSTGALANVMTMSNNGGVQFLMENTASGAQSWNLAVFSNSFVVSRPGSGGSEFEITNGGTFLFRNGGTTLMEISNTGDVRSATGTFGTLSDRAAKTNLLPVDGAEILGRIANLPILEWNYSHQSDTVRHIGPMAQDFFKAFGLFGSNKMIAITDLAGVALAGIKELNEAMNRKDDELDQLKAENAALASDLEALQSENTVLKNRLDRIELMLSNLEGNK